MNSLRNTFFYVLSLILLTILFYPAIARCETKSNNNVVLHHPEIVKTIYAQLYIEPVWYTSALTDIKDRFLQVLDSAQYSGMDKLKYHYVELKRPALDSAGLAANALLLIDGIFSYSRDLYTGANIGAQLDNDEISAKCANNDDNYIADQLTKIKLPVELTGFLKGLEPDNENYMSLKNELYAQVGTNNRSNIKQLAASLNYLRWINHFHFPQYILVNIPTATMQYVENNVAKLQMKVVVGKRATPTPRFSSYCNKVILYPYWNVPKTIGAKELLPKVMKNPSEMEEMDMQLVDDRGNVVDHHSINWSSYDGGNFPYIFRQSTGCGNALGVIKFNLTDPFDVYMHDTNLKNKFLSTSRYFSHGCIRLQKPLELANMLLPEAIDSDIVNSCLVGQSPVIKPLEKPVPVFVVYITPIRSDNGLAFNDVYNLYK